MVVMMVVVMVMVMVVMMILDDGGGPVSPSQRTSYHANTNPRQAPTQALLLGGCQHPVSTPSVDTYLNDIRFGRCQHWVSTPTKGDTALLGVDT